MGKTSAFVLIMLLFFTLSLQSQDKFDDIIFKNVKNCTIDKQEGLLTIYFVDKKVYSVIPSSILGKDLMLTNTITKAPAQKNRNFTKRYGYNGDFFGPILLKLRKKGNELLFLDPITNCLNIDSTNSFYKILGNGEKERLFFKIPIIDTSNSQLLVDLTSTLLDEDLFSLIPYKFELGIGSEEHSKKFIDGINVSPNRVEFRIKRNYQLLPPNNQATCWEHSISIEKSNYHVFDKQKYDSRVGYFFSSYKDNSDLIAPKEIRYAKRWRLELSKKDSINYQKGILVEPLNPIIFYIDNKTPKKWIPYFIEAVNSWQIAFEQAGFKNAIQGKVAPTKHENPYFSENSVAYPYISWKTSAISNAFGPSPINPRTGEIITSHVGVYSGVTDFLQQWYFAQCGVTDKRALEYPLPDEIMGTLLRMVIAHEVGHSLGLEHNFYASSNYSIDQLQNNDFLSENSISTSIMDYVRCNYALRPTDKVDLENKVARIGIYDKMAIEWGYRIFPGNTPQEREKNREKWLLEKQKNPWNLYRNDVDFKVMEEDLGNDNVAINTQGIKNMMQLIQMPIWNIKDNVPHSFLISRYNAILTHYKRMIYQVVVHLGGVTKSTEGYVPENDTDRNRTVNFIKEYVIKEPSWLLNKEFINNLQLKKEDIIKDICSSIVGIFVNRYKDVNYNNSNEVLNNYLQDFHSVIFKEWINNTVSSEYSYIFKEMYVNELIRFFNSSKSAQIKISLWEELKRIKLSGEKYCSLSNSDIEKERIKYLLWLIEKI